MAQQKCFLSSLTGFIGKGCTPKAVNTLFTSIGKRKKEGILAALSSEDFGSSSTGESGVNSNPKTKAPTQRVISGRVSRARSTNTKKGQSDAMLYNYFKQEIDGESLPITPSTSGGEASSKVDCAGNGESSGVHASKRTSSRQVKGHDYKVLAAEDDDAKDAAVAFGNDPEYDFIPEGNEDSYLSF